MPYIIETRYDHEPAARRLEAAGYVGEAFQLRHSVPTRTAVATLDEARKVVWGPLDWRGTCEHIGESGGTVGPLPDGTVIEVRFADWAEISEPFQYAFANVPQEERRQRLLAAFNAQEEVF